MNFDKPSSKRVGGPRFNGSGMKNKDPRPGTLEFYRMHMPERLNNTKIAVRNTGGYDDKTSEVIASRILHWNEGPIAHMKFDNPSLKQMKEKQDA